MLPFPSLTRTDPRFPPQLRNILEPPDELFYRGDSFPELLTKPLVAIVGTRRMTSYGRSVIQQIVPPLVRAGCVIVSGLALGCDGEAHRTTLASGGHTIAVLGSGIDNDSIYPRNHFKLAQDIISKQGAIVSEFEPGTPSLPHHFPIRNRIIAGLARATIVIEAEIKSGSLITAKFALEFGRDVFAVPGPIHAPYSTGTNYLIQHGANLLSNASEILECLGLETRSLGPESSSGQAFGMTTKTEDEFLKFFTEPRDFDSLIEATKLTSSELMSKLTMLELDGYIIRANSTWIRKR